MNTKEFMHDFTMYMLSEMPESKKETLRKACERNDYLTSFYGLSSNQVIHVYKEGWYLQLDGTRCSFKVWAYDNDGEFVFARKPKESKLHKLYSVGFRGLYTLDVADVL